MVSFIRNMCPFFSRACQNTEHAQIPDVFHLHDWAMRAMSEVCRLNVLREHGLYSLLEKDIVEASKMIQEGTHFVYASTHALPVQEHIIEMVRPHLYQMQFAVQRAELSCSSHQNALKKDRKIEKKWLELGLPISVLENHADCARFLVESKLIFAMVGFENTCEDSTQHGLHLDEDGHPLIKVHGQFRRWELLKKEIVYDSQEEQIKSSAYPGCIVQLWNYYHPQGLMPVDRFHYTRAFPIYELSENAYNQLRMHAMRFYDTNPQKDLGIPKECILQFFTSPRRQGLPNHFLFDNACRQYPVHIGIRLITSDRKVYSFGYQLPVEEQRKVLSNPLSTIQTTADGRISMLDYEEFREHEGRLVTSIPITSQYAENVLEHIAALNARQLRFNFARQNCSVLVNEVMPSDYQVDMRTTVAQGLWEGLPSVTQIPYVGHLMRKILRIWSAFVKKMPETFLRVFVWVEKSLLALPRKCVTIVANLFLWKLGATKQTRPLQMLDQEEVFYDKRKFQSFSTLIRSCWDVFKDQTCVVYHAKYFIEWQKKQSSTVFYPPGPPQLAGLRVDFQ